MKVKKLMDLMAGVLVSAVTAAILLSFLCAVTNLSLGRVEEEKRHLETVLRQAAVACYAAEGIYPPQLSYLEEHYGIQINDDRYTVTYDVTAENLMPDITVLEKN